jgi:hypothetical protein
MWTDDDTENVVIALAWVVAIGGVGALLWAFL